MKRFFAGMAIVLAAGLVGIALLHGKPRPPRPPNVVLMVIGGARADRLEAARGAFPVMPRLLAFAEAGLRFSNAGGAEPGSVPPDPFGTMWEWFARQGYRTFAVHARAEPAGASRFARDYDRDGYLYHEKGNAEWVTEQALGGAWAMDEPFFLHVHYTDARAPHAIPAHYEPPWDSASVTPDDGQGPAAQYDAALHFVDGLAAELMARLREDFPDTLFAVTADHAALPEEPAGQARVPLFFFGPGIKAGVSDTPASLLDLLPTLAGLLGLPSEPGWQGRNLLDSGEAGVARP